MATMRPYSFTSSPPTKTSPSSPSLKLTAQLPHPQHYLQHYSTLLHDTTATELSETTLTAIAEAVALANAAAQAARDAVSSAAALCEIIRVQSEDENLSVRRLQRRRRLRKDVQQELVKGEELGKREGMSGYCSTKCERSRYLTSKQEAEFSLYLKEAAAIEAVEKMHGATEVSRSGHRLRAASMVCSRKQRREGERVLLKARECRERITSSYKRLVMSIARPYQGRGLGLEDLVQEGCIGLLQGAQRFDCKKGYKLSTYVYWWIKQAILRAIANKSRMVRLPGSTSIAAAKVKEASTLLREKLGRCPNYDEIADFLDMDVSRVQLVRERSRRPISVNQPINSDGMTLNDIIPGPDRMRPEVIVSRQMMLESMENMLKTLDKREECVVRLHYGLGGEAARSCEEIARLLSLSRERVRQIHWTAITRLQDHNTLIGSLIDINL